MLTSITALGRNGLSDWLIQRVSAVIIAAYVFCLIGFLVCTSGPITYGVWKTFMTSTGMRVFSLLAFVAIAAHAWIGLWTISTDYLKGLKLRLAFQGVCALALICCLLWAILILWS